MSAWSPLRAGDRVSYVGSALESEEHPDQVGVEGTIRSADGDLLVVRLADGTVIDGLTVEFDLRGSSRRAVNEIG